MQPLAFPLGLAIAHRHTVMNACVVQHHDRWDGNTAGQAVKKPDDIVTGHRACYGFPDQMVRLLQAAQHVGPLLMRVRTAAKRLAAQAPARLQWRDRAEAGLVKKAQRQRSSQGLLPQCIELLDKARHLLGIPFFLSWCGSACN